MNADTKKGLKLVAGIGIVMIVLLLVSTVNFVDVNYTQFQEAGGESDFAGASVYPDSNDTMDVSVMTIEDFDDRSKTTGIEIRIVRNEKLTEEEALAEYEKVTEEDQ